MKYDFENERVDKGPWRRVTMSRLEQPTTTFTVCVPASQLEGVKVGYLVGMRTAPGVYEGNWFVDEIGPEQDHQYIGAPPDWDAP